MERNTETKEIDRKAGVLWTGDSRTGKGLMSTESRALFEHPFSYRTHFEEEPGTNPEELIAAAHAACFSMALAGTLKKKGFDPVKTDTNASCIMTSNNGGGYSITKMRLHIRSEVPNIDDATFQKLVEETNKVCIVSNLLRKGLVIEIDAELV